MESVLEWLNENEYRGYPFVDGTLTDPIGNDFLLDLQLVMTDETITSDVPAFIGLEKDAENLILNFNGGNSFVIPLTQIQSKKYWRNELGSLAVIGPGAVRLAADTQVQTVETVIPVEPATVYHLGGAWLGVKSIAPYRGYLSSIGTAEPLLPLEVDEDDLKQTGDIELVEGYNYKINFNNGKINLAAGFGFGIPMSCSTEFIRPQDKDCDELVSYINGIPPDTDGIFHFTPGENIYIFDGNTVTEDIPDTTVEPTIPRVNENTVFVGLTFLETDLCSPVQLLPTNN